MASWGPFGGAAGILLGSATAALANSVLPPEAVEAWGWRVPFLLGLLVGLGGLYIRQHLPETASPPPAEAQAGSPIVEAFRSEWRTILRLMGLNVLTAVGFYEIFVYSVTWFEVQVGAPAEEALDINTLNLGLSLLLIPFAAALSDRLGRRPVLLGSSLAVLLLAWPLFWLMDHPNFWPMMLGQFAFTLLLVPFLATVPVTAVEICPARVRCTAVSVGYNVSLGVLGGLTPMLATAIVGMSQDDRAPAWLLMLAAAISFVVVLAMRETAHEPLR
jgi:MHS family proline/betaine transporter-like MFS transporter